MKYEASYYTTQCVIALYDYIKEDFEETKGTYDPNDRKYFLAIYNLLDVVIDKLKISLIKEKEDKKIKITLKKYQGYFLSRFLFEKREQFEGIAERTFLNTLAIAIDVKV